MAPRLTADLLPLKSRHICFRVQRWPSRSLDQTCSKWASFPWGLHIIIPNFQQLNIEEGVIAKVCRRPLWPIARVCVSVSRSPDWSQAPGAGEESNRLFWVRSGLQDLKCCFVAKLLALLDFCNGQRGHSFETLDGFWSLGTVGRTSQAKL